ncbi:DUF1080 domain-containing protein [candidate division KSB1 bacterium]|nr:DUF1080 domain-containing protein [candidate division KSB1 bacterium]
MESRTRLTNMIIIVIVLSICGVYLLCTEDESGSSSANKNEPEFVPIFNGKNLDGWRVEQVSAVYYVENGLLICKGNPRPPNVILTDKSYENFILELDFRMAPGCNSGVFIHAPEEGRQSKTGFEIQILDDFGREPTKYSSGAMYDLAQPDTNAIRPAGQWNQYRILMDWPIVRVWLNTIQIHDVDLSADHIMRYRLRVGPIGLQNHGHFIEFKNLRVKELPGKIAYESLFNGKDLSNWTSLGDANWHVENGFIVATQGDGYLVSQKKYENFELQTLAMRNHFACGGIYYRWLSQDDPGYLAEFYDYMDAVHYTAKYVDHFPEYVLPAHNCDGFLVQLLNFERQSEWRINGSISAINMTHQKIRPGYIALYHTGMDTIRIKDLRIRNLEAW